MFSNFMLIYIRTNDENIFLLNKALFLMPQKENTVTVVKRILQKTVIYKSQYIDFFHQLQATENKKVLVLQIQQF